MPGREAPAALQRRLPHGLFIVPARVRRRRTFSAILFPRALARQRALHAPFLARFQVVGMTLHLFDNVFRLDLAFESAQRILQRFTLLQANFCQAHSPSPNYRLKHELLAAVVSGRLFRGSSVLGAHIEKRGLLFRVPAHFSHFVDAANGLFLFALIPALCFVPLSLLPCLLLLTLGERRSASWHRCPPDSLISFRQACCQPDRMYDLFRKSYQRGSRGCRG